MPGWEHVLQLAAQSYDAIPLGYFGIDLVIDAALGPTILELNARPGLSIQLANRCGLRRLLAALDRHAVAGRTAADRVTLGLEIAADTPRVSAGLP